MGWNTPLVAVGAAALIAGAATAARAAGDACALLTAAQVGTAVGEPVGAGAPITPTDHKVCSWHAASGPTYVTLMLQTAQSADASRRAMSAMAGRAVVTDAPGLGDGAYYLAIGDQVGLIVKKGAGAFKVEVYQHGPLEKKQAAERTLAGQAVGRM